MDAINSANGDAAIGQVILDFIGGAQNTAEFNDRTTLLNKIEVGIDWFEAAKASGITTDAEYLADDDAVESAEDIIDDVTDEQSTVDAAKAEIDEEFQPAPPPAVPGNDIFLTSSTDVSGMNGLESSDNDDTFYGYIAQNPFAGGVSNSLSSADRLDGEGGNDRLYAELSKEFLGASGENSQATDIQPRLTSIETIDIEARDDTQDNPNEDDTIILDAKHIVGHDKIGSYYSDGDLVIENLTTKETSDDNSARNTSEITVTMDHTDNFNSDGDAADLEVLFDNDYLLSGQTSQGFAEFFLLDEKAELNRLNGESVEGRLDEIDKNGLRFEINGEVVELSFDPALIDIDTPAGETVDTHQQFVDALRGPLAQLISDGVLPVGTTIELVEYDTVIRDASGKTLNRTGLNDGTLSELIPAIRITSGDGSPIDALGFTAPDEVTGAFDVFGEFRDEFGSTDEPISVDLDLHKAGRGGEGGDVVIGGKSVNTPDGIADGIEVINVNVKGAGNEDPDGNMTKPSNVGTITSTGNELRVINIATHSDFKDGNTYASLTVRNGFDEDVNANVETGDLERIDADGFLGDLTLGDIDAANNAGRVTNADTITAAGGGDVTLGLLYDGNEVNEAYSVTTGAGNDNVDILLDGDALDYAGSSLNVSTADGNDTIRVDFDLNNEGTGLDDSSDDSEQLNHTILDNVKIEAGSGDDTVELSGIGVANIDGGAGNDVIDTSGDSSSTAVWAFNFDAVRASDGSDDGIGDFGRDELPGEELSLAYIGGATITVTLSGAGISGDLAAGGGVMAVDNLDGDDHVGAVATEDGYEATFDIGALLNGKEYYGTQADINAAVMEAINGDDVLKKLLTVEMGPNNTLIVTSTTSGAFDETDLRIDITQADSSDDSYWSKVEAEAQDLFQDSTIVIEDLDDANAVAADLGTSADADAWYDGLSNIGDDDNSAAAGVGEGESNLHTVGTASVEETDTVINGGSGDDLIVLSTDAIEASIPAFTVSGSNALINGASNETIVLTGDNFGDDTVMNFTSGCDEDGKDFLNFDAYLTSLESDSGSSESERLIDVTLDYGTDADAGEVDANEVVVVRYTDDDNSDDTFESLSASDIEDLFNDDGDFDNGALDDANFDVSDNQNDETVVDGNAKGILMVENEGNRGEYKVFELSWDASEEDGDENVSANLLGSLDFGDTLDLEDCNIVNTEAYKALFDAVADGSDDDGGDTGGGDDGGDGGTDTGTPIDVTGDLTAVDGVAETFVYAIDSSSGDAVSLADGDYTIDGFNPTEDSIVFDDVDGGTLTTATFGDTTPTVSGNGIQNELDFIFADNADGDAYGLTLVGVSDLADVDFSVA
ncbi:hypothetical protein [Marivita sp. GX14005]|uniref:beta strand repeat-containing protein n=1 Tax=Marivita sp. GX14005 TaxID=2942276 RepID=UPI00201A1872|nr:hypothetical protein [Marivita sp. GX14005]MCL3883930.1 hypothetical protein [Marivita sp. GX14005]